jgi:hypothetical protein
MSHWDFFARRVCLTTQDAEWRKAEDEFHRVGLFGVQKFQSFGIDDKEILGPHQSFSASVRQILIDFYRSGAETLLHLEDDCQFRELSHLDAALRELPADWDICYLGANLVNATPLRHSDHLFKVDAAWTTHCVAFSRRPIEFLLKHQPGYSEMMFDCWMSTQLPSLKAYCIAPMAAWQRQHPSSIWGTNEDYTPIFEASDEKLRG